MSAPVIQTVLSSLKLLELEIPFEITATSFNACNEKLLLTILVVLLSANSDEFRTNIASSYNWPYHDTREKNACKKIIFPELQRLVQQGVITATNCVKLSILTVAKGPSVWNLLWKLSDAVLKTLVASGSDLAEDAKDTLQVGGTSELSFIETNIKLEVDRITNHTVNTLHKQKQLCEYANELNRRFKRATNNIDSINKTLQTLESQMGNFLIDERFNNECQQIINRVESFSALLEYLLSKKKRKTTEKSANKGSIVKSISSSDVENLLNQCLSRMHTTSTTATSSECDEDNTNNPSQASMKQPPSSLENALSILNARVLECVEMAYTSKDDQIWTPSSSTKSHNIHELNHSTHQSTSENRDGKDSCARDVTQMLLSLENAAKRRAHLTGAVRTLRSEVASAAAQVS
jgi:hypothetical protein